MKNDDDKRLRKIRDKDKAIRLQKRRRDTLAARYSEENYFDGVLTDKQDGNNKQKKCSNRNLNRINKPQFSIEDLALKSWSKKYSE